MRLTIPDDLADSFLPYLPATGHNAAEDRGGPKSDTPQLEALLLRVLSKALPLAEEGSLVISRKGATQLGTYLLTDHVGDEKVLLDATSNLCDLKIGKHRLGLPLPILKALRERAAREDKDFGEFLQGVINKLVEDMGMYG